eukprot:TRINITY_DN3987_c0_g2_i2.p1 TRINITY_DN3987_c0_g2~~TRINITY_DN3987_c0_g2_i2.p1  ORF type:complete len:807 (-),score=257.15 TRINITY_DN3987_c0_g2_i2:23-2443(-)
MSGDTGKSTARGEKEEQEIDIVLLFSFRSIFFFSFLQIAKLARPFTYPVVDSSNRTYGELGTNQFQHEKLPVANYAFRGTKIEKIACGFRHTLLLTEEGKVMSFGGNSFGQLGACGTKNQCYPSVIPTFFDRKVIDIACGIQHSVAVTDDGVVWTWGFDGRGQLGRAGKAIKPNPVISDTLNAVKVAAGQGHTVALDADGHVWAWGRGTEGQLGHTEGRDYCNPRMLKKGLEDVTIVDIDCGSLFTILLSDDGGIYTFGCGDNDECAMGRDYLYYPRRIKFFDDKDVIGMSSGWKHTAVLTADGNVYTWGAGDDYQLGHGEAEGCPVPKMVGPLCGTVIVDVKCGWKHTVAVSSQGDVFAWGKNTYFACGTLENSDDKSVALPKLIMTGKRVTKVFVGSENNYAIIEEPDEFALGMQLKTILNDPLFADVYFVLEGSRIIYAHQVILRTRCDEFLDMFLFNQHSPKQRLRVDIEEEWITYDVFYAMLEHIYSDIVVDLSVELAEPLMKLAKQYRLHRLEVLCARTLGIKKASHPLPPSLLGSDMLNILNSDEFSDVVFMVDGNELVYAHKAVLFARGGPEFCEAVGLEFDRDDIIWEEGQHAGDDDENGDGDGEEEGDEDDDGDDDDIPDMDGSDDVGDDDDDDIADFVNVDDTQMEVFLRLIEFLYTDDKSAIPEHIAFQLLSCCSTYKVPVLLEVCSTLVQTTVKVESVAYMYQVSKLTNSVNLATFCKHFIIANWAALEELDFLGLEGEELEEIKSFKKEYADTVDDEGSSSSNSEGKKKFAFNLLGVFGGRGGGNSKRSRSL